jgi:hypothetical protein
MNDLLQNKLDIWEYNGKLFGYPECCIAEFSKNPIANDRPHIDVVHKSIFAGTGYIPCTKCIGKNHRQLLVEIDNNRHPDLMPFPNRKWKKDVNKNI